MSTRLLPTALAVLCGSASGFSPIMQQPRVYSQRAAPLSISSAPASTPSSGHVCAARGSPRTRVAASLTAHRRAHVTVGSTSDFKVGLTIELEGSVWKVQEFLHVKPGKGSAFVRSKLKNLETGSTLEKTWKAGESFPDAQVDKEEMTFSYIDGDDHVFMNMNTFEEERIATAAIDKADFLKEESTINVLYWNGKAIDVQVPNVVVLKVTEAAPGAKGNTAQGRAEKPATLETGAIVNVPIFIEEGEMVRIDTDTKKYLGRSND